MTGYELFQALVAVEIFTALIGAWAAVDAVHQTALSRSRTRRCR